MLRQTHIIHIRLLRTGIRQQDRIIPEPESVDPVITLSHTEERLPVIPLDTGYQIKLAVQLNSAGIHDRIDTEALHEIRIRLRVQVVLPG